MERWPGAPGWTPALSDSPADAPVELILGQHGGTRPGAGRPAGAKAEIYEKLARAKAKRESYRALMAEMEYRQKAGELIPVAVHERELAAVLKVVAVTIESLPDVLERDAGISGEAVARCQLICDRTREGLYKRLIELTHASDELKSAGN